MTKYHLNYAQMGEHCVICGERAELSYYPHHNKDGGVPAQAVMPYCGKHIARPILTEANGIAMEKLPDGNLAIIANEKLQAELRELEAEDEYTHPLTDDEVIEYQLGNGWSWIAPETIGALTSRPIIAEDVEENEDDMPRPVGMFWHDPQYETRVWCEDLANEGYVILQGADVRIDDAKQQEIALQRVCEAENVALAQVLQSSHWTDGGMGFTIQPLGQSKQVDITVNACGKVTRYESKSGE